jgi:hypothetical protein
LYGFLWVLVGCGRSYWILGGTIQILHFLTSSFPVSSHQPGILAHFLYVLVGCGKFWSALVGLVTGVFQWVLVRSGASCCVLVGVICSVRGGLACSDWFWSVLVRSGVFR